uniref:Receptor expression-enhancing protein n=1 Tax=Anopheles atroparvus TaxID=41427 RepID=A0AAG5DP73_ANOAO
MRRNPSFSSSRAESPSNSSRQQANGSANNVSDLISKFEVRSYPINRGLLSNPAAYDLSSCTPEEAVLRSAGFYQDGTSLVYSPTPGSAQTSTKEGPALRQFGFCKDSTTPFYSPTPRAAPAGEERHCRARRHDPENHPTAVPAYGAESVSRPRVKMDAGARVRQPRAQPYYYHNGSLSSLNESDYYDEYEGLRTPPGRFYPSPHDVPSATGRSGLVFEEVEEDVVVNKAQVAGSLSRFGAILQMLARIPFPRMSVTGMGLCSLVAIFFCPRALGSNILFPGFRLLFGTLYPAYASYKAVRTKNVKEYVKWMMYWIVFAFFTCIETFTDILLSWFPFYYEIKVIIVLWLLSPATRGSSTLYRKFVHPMLTRREQEIDDYINQAKEKGYTAVLQLGSKGVNYATNVIMQTAIKAFGTKSDTPLRSMIRVSQSDNSLLLATAAAAALATTGYDSGAASATGGSRGGNSHDSATSGEDERDGFQQRPAGQSTSSSSLAAGGRVRRSQSVDSALNAHRSGGVTRSSVSRSVTRAAAAAASGLDRYPNDVIYEMDSEEEQQFLATETDIALAGRYATLPGRSRSRTAATHVGPSGEESDGTESTASRGQSRTTDAGSKVAKRKPTTSLQQDPQEQAKKASRTAASGNTKAATTAARGRKKARKDSDSNDMDVE